MNIRWTPEARQDRIDIWDYVAQDDPMAAVRLDELFSESVRRLSTHPNLGHVGMIEGTRELIPHQSYRIVYEIYKDTVWILTLVHTAQQWPPIK
jgi:addiction module RelE/StbE family toxin